jgi:hypothetical protein
VKTIPHSSGAAPSRLAYWFVAAIAVLLVIFAISEIPWAPVRFAAATAPVHAVLPMVESPSRVDGDASGNGVPDASAVFRGRETQPEEPAPTF